MSEIQIFLPKLGESIVSATVVQWFKKVGDTVKLDEPLLEVSTDKVNSEIPSPNAGVLVKILAEPDTELAVGAPLCAIKTAEGQQITVRKEEEKEEISAETTSSQRQYFSPVVLKIVEMEGIPLEDLKHIKGTGLGGRVSKKDIEAHVAKKVCPLNSNVERIKMSSMRKSIAENMVKSFYQAPHATLVCEVDVTKILQLIQKEKEEFYKKHEAKLTITSFIAKAIANAVKEFPFINASLEQDTILLKQFVNLGIAVSVDQGILVPVIKSCHLKNITELAEEIGKISEKARTGKLDPDDVKEGTITLTNFGMSGMLIGIPIIRYPEVAIIGIGAIHKKVAAMPDDSIAIRNSMHISLTFDHRVLDGMYGCGFLSSVKKHLEQISSVD